MRLNFLKLITILRCLKYYYCLLVDSDDDYETIDDNSDSGCAQAPKQTGNSNKVNTTMVEILLIRRPTDVKYAVE